MEFLNNEQTLDFLFIYHHIKSVVQSYINIGIEICKKNWH